MLPATIPSTSSDPPIRTNSVPVYFTAKRLKFYLCALLAMQVIICAGFRSSIRSGSIDFRLYYTAGYMLRTGDAAHLYDYAAEQRVQNAIVTPQPSALPFFAPPIAALLFVPFSFAPYLWALLILGIFNLLCLMLAVRVLKPHLRSLAARWRPLPALLFLCFLPAGFTLTMGQLSIVILLLDALAYVLVEAGSPFLAGLVLSLGLIKFQTAIPIALLFLLWRRWRFALGFLTGGAALLALSLRITGLHGIVLYARSITHMSTLAGTPLQGAVGTAPRAMANLYGLFFMLAPTNHVATILTLISSVLLIAWAATRRPSFPLALLVAMLVSYHLYPCDLTLALLPVSLLCNRLFFEEVAPPIYASSTRSRSYRAPILLCALGALLISPLMVEIISNNLIFLYALPVLALAFCPSDWSTVTLVSPALEEATGPTPAFP